MDYLDLIMDMDAADLSDLVSAIANTPEVEIEMADDGDDAGAHVSDEMRHLAIKASKLGQQLSATLLAWQEAKQRAAAK